MTSFPSPPGEPIAAGREADVFALDDERVLRRYRSAEDVTAETAVMRYAAEHGYPVPRVHAARGPDLILERLNGPTMGEALVAGQLSVPDGAAITADLLRHLHTLPRTILHLDLHPENVLLTERGPAVLDLFLALAPGDPVRLLDDAVGRSRQYRILSVGEIGMLDTAADRVRKGR